MAGGRSHCAHARRDANEPEIISALEAAGCVVSQVDTPAIGDLIVWFRVNPTDDVTHTGLIEVKAAGKVTLTASQQLFAPVAQDRGYLYAIVQTPPEARQAVEEWRNRLRRWAAGTGKKRSK